MIGGLAGMAKPNFNISGSSGQYLKFVGNSTRGSNQFTGNLKLKEHL